MSLLRLSRPGYPTQLIVQEPAHAHVMGHGGAALGYFSGTTLKPEPKKDRERREQREAKARTGRPPRSVERCNISTRFGDPCGRTPGHKPPHKSPGAVARIAARMRAA